MKLIVLWYIRVSLPSQFVHSVIDSIGGKEGPKYATFSKSLSLEQFCKLKTALVAFVKLCVHEKHEPSKVRASYFNAL